MISIFERWMESNFHLLILYFVFRHGLFCKALTCFRKYYRIVGRFVNAGLNKISRCRANVQQNSQRFPLYHVEYRAQIETLFGGVLCWFFPRSYHLMTAFDLRNWRFSGKINLYQTVGIHNNNLDFKGLWRQWSWPVWGNVPPVSWSP
jgi:hypothetical protein